MSLTKWLLLVFLGFLLLTTCSIVATRHRPSPTPPARENCTSVTAVTEGPYWLEEDIQASNVRWNLSYGVPLNITFKTVDGAQSSLNNECVTMENVRIDLWQCRYDGAYSDEEEESTDGEKWLRGYQYTNSTGYATFYSIYPGWYTSRTVHIHVRVRIYEADGNTTAYDETTQLYFDDTVSEAIYRNVYPYNSRGGAERDSFNTNDTLFTTSNLIAVVGSYNNTDGYSSIVELSLPFSSPAGQSIVANGNSISAGFSAVA